MAIAAADQKATTTPSVTIGQRAAAAAAADGQRA